MIARKKYITFFLLAIQQKKKEDKQNKDLLMEPGKINEVFLIFLVTAETVFIPPWRRQLCHSSKKQERNTKVRTELGQIPPVTL